MNGALFQICFVIFLAAPAVILAFRFWNKRWMPWWQILVLIPFVGWVSANLTVHFYFEHLKDLLALNPNDPALAKELNAGGAKRENAWLFGWLYGLVYAGPWLVVYVLAEIIRAQMRKMRSILSGTPSNPSAMHQSNEPKGKT